MSYKHKYLKYKKKYLDLKDQVGGDKLDKKVERIIKEKKKVIDNKTPDEIFGKNLEFLPFPKHRYVPGVRNELIYPQYTRINSIFYPSYDEIHSYDWIIPNIENENLGLRAMFLRYYKKQIDNMITKQYYFLDLEEYHSNSFVDKYWNKKKGPIKTKLDKLKLLMLEKVIDFNIDITKEQANGYFIEIKNLIRNGKYFNFYKYLYPKIELSGHSLIDNHYSFSLSNMKESPNLEKFIKDNQTTVGDNINHRRVASSNKLKACLLAKALNDVSEIINRNKIYEKFILVRKKEDAIYLSDGLLKSQIENEKTKLSNSFLSKSKHKELIKQYENKSKDNNMILMNLKIISHLLRQIIVLPQLLRYMMIYITPKYVGEEEWKIPELSSNYKISQTIKDVVEKNLPEIGDEEREIARDYERFCN